MEQSFAKECTEAMWRKDFQASFEKWLSEHDVDCISTLEDFKQYNEDNKVLLSFILAPALIRTDYCNATDPIHTNESGHDSTTIMARKRCSK
jgi:hypothetical protein